MIITWAATGTPRYPSEDGTIPYISDIGASYLKPLFITGCSITAVGFVTCLLIERLLRNHGRYVSGPSRLTHRVLNSDTPHHTRLVENFRRRERTLAWLAVLGSLIGGAGLVLLSVFDTLRHPSLHRLFLLVFMVGVALSALFTILEFRWISKDFGGSRRLKRAYWMKGVIATILIICAIAFAGTLYGKGQTSTNAAAVLEWTIAFGYTFVSSLTYISHVDSPFALADCTSSPSGTTSTSPRAVTVANSPPTGSWGSNMVRAGQVSETATTVQVRTPVRRRASRWDTAMGTDA
jgi:hypothetical protein